MMVVVKRTLHTHTQWKAVLLLSSIGSCWGDYSVILLAQKPPSFSDVLDRWWWDGARRVIIIMDPALSKGKHKPLKMIAKFFNKSKRTASVPEVNTNEQDTDFNAVETELEALHLSRTDNPYLQVLSSQDNLDHVDDKSSSTVLMSPPESISPTRSYAGGGNHSLSEIHAHLVRSPPPVSWPMSPRSNGTFSPDSSDGMDVDNPLPNSQSIVASPPTRGYSPYNRSQSEEHILSPCKDLLKSAEFSPVSLIIYRVHSTEMLLHKMAFTQGCLPWPGNNGLLTWLLNKQFFQ